MCGMLQPGGEPDLLAEALGADRLGQLGRQHLDDDRPVERALGRDEDARHPAAAELALDPVARDQRGLKPILHHLDRASTRTGRFRLDA